MQPPTQFHSNSQYGKWRVKNLAKSSKTLPFSQAKSYRLKEYLPKRTLFRPSFALMKFKNTQNKRTFRILGRLQQIEANLP